jgi:shikimate kinase
MNLQQPTTNIYIQNTNLFFLIGSMGTGKTYWGSVIAEEKEINCIDLDTLIEHYLGMSIADIFETYGEIFFRAKETEVLIKIIASNKKAIIATGGGTACFNDNMKLMNDSGVTIWLNDSINKIIERIKPLKELRPLLKNIPNEQLYSYLQNLNNFRKPFYAQCKYQLNETQISTSEILKIINQYV